MARVEVAPEVFDDLDRIFDYETRNAISHASDHIAAIVQAIDVLAYSPFIGRQARGGKRELIIGQKSRGYVALYRYVPKIDTVLVLAVRSQREAGYTRA